MVRKGLEKAFPKAPFETLNAGVPGYSSFQGMLYLETILPRFRPDVVVAEYGEKQLTPSVNFLTSYSILIHKTLSSYPPEVLQALFLPFDQGHLSKKGHNVVGKCMVDFLTPRIAANSGEWK